MVSYCYISHEIDDRRLRCIIDLLQARLAWARQRRRYDLRYWRRVHWSDESYFQLQKVDGRVRVWRRPGERFHQECILPRLVSGRVSVSVWGCSSHDCKLELMDIRGNTTGIRYQDEILATQVEPQIDGQPLAHRPWFMHDGVSTHTARVS